MHFTTAIFDMDGTLFDTERLGMAAFAAAFAEHGVQLSRQTLATVIGGGVNETRAFLSRFAPVGIGIEAIMHEAVTSIRGEIEREGLPMKPGVRELLGDLKGDGVAVGLATSTRTPQALVNLQRAGIAGYFDAVIGGDQVSRAKPHPEIYLKALDALKAHPGDAIAVEDSDHGIRSAFAAGLRVIHVPDIKEIDAQTLACVHRQYRTLLDFRAELAAGRQR